MNYVLICIFIFLVLTALGFILYFTRNAKEKFCSKLPEKYFHEYQNNGHLDAEYGKGFSHHINMEAELVDLYREFMVLSKEINLHPILMYGGLIGHHFDKKLLPWDDDIDLIIVGEDEIGKIVSKHGWETRDYILKVNPNYNNKSKNDYNNKIDARFISKKYGLFIDFMFFWEDKNMFFSKADKNNYHKDLVLPYQKDILYSNKNGVGIPIYIPHNPVDCLVKRYGKDVLDAGGHGPPGMYNKAWTFKNNNWVKEF